MFALSKFMSLGTQSCVHVAILSVLVCLAVRNTWKVFMFFFSTSTKHSLGFEILARALSCEARYSGPWSHCATNPKAVSAASGCFSFKWFQIFFPFTFRSVSLVPLHNMAEALSRRRRSHLAQYKSYGANLGKDHARHKHKGGIY